MTILSPIQTRHQKPNIENQKLGFSFPLFMSCLHKGENSLSLNRKKLPILKQLSPVNGGMYVSTYSTLMLHATCYLEREYH